MTTSTLTRVASVALLASLALAGCGGGKSTSTATQSGAAPQAVPTTEAQREAAALPQTVMQPVPNDLKCGAVKPVWVNLHTKAYHEPADPYYGRTKSGKYMCPSAAQAAGYHPAGHKKSSMTSGNTMEGSNAAMMGNGKHHRKSGSMEMSVPSPEPT